MTSKHVTEPPRSGLPYPPPRAMHAAGGYLARFLAIVLAFCAIAIWANLRLSTFRESPLDFHKLSERDLVIVHGLTRRQEGGLKLGFAETFDPPEVGLFGNHSFQYFGASAFGRPFDSRYFFNYWFANLSLPEVRDYLLHLEDKRKLPKKLILVQITTPNNDNGGVIVDLNYELPPDLLLEGALRADAPIEKVRSFVGAIWNLLEGALHQIFGYQTFILGLRGSTMDGRVLDITHCQASEIGKDLSLIERLMLLMPATLRELASAVDARYYCNREFWRSAFQRDGSHNANFNQRNPIKNASNLSDKTRRLVFGDETRIARYMREIAAIGRRNDVATAFVVPPVYEDIRPSIVDEIFDGAMQLVPDLNVLDHRSLRGDPVFFMRFDHPSPEYFRVLAVDLQSRGLVEKK